MMSEEYCFRSDDDGHWYIIPLSMKERFDELLYADDEYADFNSTFGLMQSSGPSSYVFKEWRYV